MNRGANLKIQANNRIINLLIDVLCKHVWCKIGDYKDSQDLWQKVGNLLENPSLAQEMKEFKDKNSSAQTEKNR